jgi:hypothetical protein
MNTTLPQMTLLCTGLIAIGLACAGAAIADATLSGWRWYRARCPRRNRRKWWRGRPRDDRGAGLRGLATIQAHAILGERSRRGWQTRRRRLDDTRRVGVGRDVEAMLNAESMRGCKQSPLTPCSTIGGTP